MPPVNRNQPKRAASSESQYSLMEFMREFPDDATCLEWLWRNRYSEDGEHAFCETCQQKRVFKRYETKQQRQSWSCTACADKIHPMAGTIFHKSSTSLHLWFYAMYLMTSTRCGISAKQMERELGVTYKTAWRMCHLIRHELVADDETPVEGMVEADETWVGGRVRYRGANQPTLNPDGTRKRGRRPMSQENKTPVFGAVQRGGRVMAVVVPDVKRASLLPHIQRRVMPTGTIFTDELKSYDTLPRSGYYHQRVNHKAGVWVSGDAHTNTIEGFWSLTKNGILGVYHAVSSKHLQGYLNEYAWRYNHRNGDRAMFQTLIRRSVGS